MNISKDLLLAILSMDAYNQGYGQGVEHGATQIGKDATRVRIITPARHYKYKAARRMAA